MEVDVNVASGSPLPGMKVTAVSVSVFLVCMFKSWVEFQISKRYTACSS